MSIPKDSLPQAVSEQNPQPSNSDEQANNNNDKHQPEQEEQEEEEKQELKEEWKEMLTEDVLEEWLEDPMYAFVKGVKWAFRCWQVLELAVHQAWGGQSSKLKRDNLAATVINLLGDKKGKVQEHKLEDLLDDYMLQNFNMQVEDGSSRWVARVSMALYDDCVNKQDFTGLARLLSQRPEFDKSQNGWASGDEDGDESDGYYDEDDEYTDEDDEEEEEEVQTDGKQTTNGGKEEEKKQQSTPVHGETSSSSTNVSISTLTPEQQQDVDDGWEVVTSKRGRNR